MGGQLLRFFQRQTWPLQKRDLTTINEDDFEAVLSALLDGKQGPLLRVFQPVEADLLLIYVMRNQAGHGIESSPTINRRFSELLDRTFFGLFAIAERLF